MANMIEFCILFYLIYKLKYVSGWEPSKMARVLIELQKLANGV
jgi:hypothetical protein